MVKLLAFMCLSVYLCGIAAEQYTNKFDGIDVDKVLQSDRLIDNYYKCLMEKGPCTPAGAELKKSLPDALRTECSKCSGKQKANADKVVSHLERKKPRLFADLEKKYDPSGEYRKREEIKKARKV